MHERAVRITALLTCPNWRCGRVLYSPRPRVGETWMSCTRGDGWSHRSAACGQHWLNITLPAASTGADLARLVGKAEALALLAMAWQSEVGIDAELLKLPLLVTDRGDKPVHVQIPCRGRDEHLYRYAPLRSFLRALKLAS